MVNNGFLKIPSKTLVINRLWASNSLYPSHLPLSQAGDIKCSKNRTFYSIHDLLKAHMQNARFWPDPYVTLEKSEINGNIMKGFRIFGLFYEEPDGENINKTAGFYQQPMSRVMVSGLDAIFNSGSHAVDWAIEEAGGGIKWNNSDEEYENIEAQLGRVLLKLKGTNFRDAFICFPRLLNLIKHNELPVQKITLTIGDQSSGSKMMDPNFIEAWIGMGDPAKFASFDSKNATAIDNLVRDALASALDQGCHGVRQLLSRR